MSLNTIIIGLIVLVVLVILIAIFTGFSGNVAKDVTSCESAGGRCIGGTTRAGGNHCGTDFFNKDEVIEPIPIEPKCKYAKDADGKKDDEGICCPRAFAR